MLLTSGASAAVIDQGATDLYLEVTINGAATHLVAHFRRNTDGTMWTSVRELEDLRVQPPVTDGDDWVALDSIEGLTYTFAPETQSLHLQVEDRGRRAQTHDAAGQAEATAEATSSYGLVVNYSAFAGSPLSADWMRFLPHGGSVALDSRVFTPFGNVEQTAIVGATLGSKSPVLRLETTFVHTDPEALRTYRAGDLISGSLPWTRSIRLGGLQVQSDFGLRPDLITVALPSLSGSAAVPSTVDVLVGSSRVYSTEVDAGPFEITNLPANLGSADAKLVVRDVTGKTVETSAPLYDTSQLLRPGLLSFSLEAGRPRMFYGLESDQYASALVGSASARYGLTPMLTLDAHAEGGAGLINAGAGASSVLGRWGRFTLALSGSRYEGAHGAKVYSSFETRWGDVRLHLSSQRTFGSFEDLASVTAPLPISTAFVPGAHIVFSSQVPRAVDQITVSMPAYVEKSALTLSLLNIVGATGKADQVAGLTYTQPLGAGHVFASGVIGLSETTRSGIFAGVSFPLGGGGHISGGGAFNDGRVALTTEASRALGTEPGSVGWRVRRTGNQSATTLAAADHSGGLSYRSAFMSLEAGAESAGGSLRGTLQAEGAIAVTKDGVFATNRIDDAFAVVDIGIPDVPVLIDNNRVAYTDFRGKALIPRLPSFEARKVSFDTTGLPLGADIQTTTQTVRPARRSGVSVDMRVRTDLRSAALELVYPNGRHVEPGTRGQIAGGESFLVGYDGQAYVRGVQETNVITVNAPERACSASFEVGPSSDGFAQVGRVVCE